MGEREEREMREERRAVRTDVSCKRARSENGAGTVPATAPQVPRGEWAVAPSFPNCRHVKF